MTALNATLFQTPVEPPSIEYQGVRFDLAFKGKSVVGSIQLETANPKGRYLCHVNYKRRAHWTDDEHAAALRVAGHWFRDIGRIVLLQGKQLGHIIARLKKGHSVEVTERCMHWAVGAYAFSEWHRTQKRWTTLGRFFVGDHFDEWLYDSPAYQSHLDRQQAELAERREREQRGRLERERADQRQRGRRQEQQTTVEAMLPLRDVPDEELRRLHEESEEYERDLDSHKDQRFRRILASIDPRARIAMLKLVRFERQNSWYHSPGQKGDMGPMSLENRNYYLAVRGRLQYLVCRHRAIDRAALDEELLADALEPPNAFRAWDIHVEIERRRATSEAASSGNDRIATVRRQLRLPASHSEKA